MPGHSHHSSHADLWTTMAAVGEGTASFISDAYWLGGLFDLATRLDDSGLGLSWYGMGFGAAIALITAAGSAYSHTVLNINHQEETNTHTNENKPLIEKNIATPPAHLSWIQRASLLGDFISHTGDIAGPITFVADITTHNTLPVWGKALVQCGATLFGGLSSVANVRTCRRSMLELNQKKLVAQDPVGASTPSLSPV